MQTILIDSVLAAHHPRASVLIGRTIVAIEFAHRAHLVLKLDDGTVVRVSGQGHEIESVEIRIEVPE